MDAAAPGRDFRDVPTREADSIGDDVAWILQRLQAAGIRQVVAVDLTKAELGLPVVRVVIPGLEGPDKGERSDYVPGPRARAAGGGRA
jgi:ribosomal protein S12 methylthiotransferase accessory factor